MTADLPQMTIFRDRPFIMTADGTILRTPRLKLSETLETARHNLSRTTVIDPSESEEKTKPIMPHVNPW